MTLRLATRRSPLAVQQATSVADELAGYGIECVIVPLETRGDQLTGPLSALGGQGIFAVEIQRAVLEHQADVAVHSAKDLPSRTPDGLRIASVPPRRDPRDVLVGSTLADLAIGATVATGSPRRKALLLERRPDLHIIDLRGNMATRLAVALQPDVAAVIVAAAALERLALTRDIADILDPTWFIPQVGQGSLALECRSDDETTAAQLAVLHDHAAGQRLRAERAFLAELGAGCAVPVAAYAESTASGLTLRGVMASRTGRRTVRGECSGADPDQLGATLARYLRDDCGGDALDE